MRYLVAIPVYNEIDTIAQVLDRTRGYAKDILVVDDGSTDGTTDYIRTQGDVVHIRHSDNRGYGQSLIDAFAWADRQGYDWVVTLDCDEQHDPARIPDFLAAADGDVDVVSGSRYLRPIGEQHLVPPDRRAINQRITDLLNDALGLEITDSFCGFKAHRVSAVRPLRLTVPGYGMPMQFWVQAASAGLRIRELSVQLIYNDPQRFFGGELDDPDARLAYYYEILIHELGRQWQKQRQARPLTVRTGTGQTRNG